jgi:hypothetical protein
VQVAAVAVAAAEHVVEEHGSGIPFPNEVWK